MSIVWKALVGLVVLLPIGAYVAGTLAAAEAPEPTPREPVVLREAPATPPPSPSAPAGAGAGDGRSPGAPGRTAGPRADDDGQGPGRVGENRVDDNGLEVVSPAPTRVGEDDDRDDADDRDDDDGDDDDDDDDD